MLIKRFLTALMFYTRIPVHASHDQNLEEATLFLPIIGLLVGGYLLLRGLRPSSSFPILSPW